MQQQPDIQNIDEDEWAEFNFRKEKWELYKPKKYYIKPVDEETVQQQLNQLEDKIRSYKYHEDIPRMLWRVAGPKRGTDMYEEVLYYMTLGGLFMGKVYARSIYSYYSTKRIERKCMLAWVLLANSLALLKAWTMPHNQPQNKDIYQQLPFEARLKNHLDYKYDLYRNVEKIKYTDKYISRHEMFRHLRQNLLKEKDIRNKLQKELGV